jgi:hypothetical protein
MGESLARNNNPDMANTAKIHYTLGRLYDRAGEYDSAFEHYHQANTVIPVHFDRNEHQI